MLTQNFLKSRTSTRDFTLNKLGEDLLKKIRTEIDEKIITQEDRNDLNFIINTDGDSVYNALDGIAGYRGIMIKAPAYIALHTLNNKAETLVKASYKLEELITSLNELGLGNCWITLADVKDSVKESTFNYEDGDVSMLLAVGYPLDESVKEHRYDDRIGNSELVYIDDFDHPASDEDLEQRGLNNIFDYAKFAPSAYNSQPWRFLIVDDQLSIYIKNYSGNVNLIDAGIIMYYIDELGKSLAMQKGWDINPQISSDKYTYIATKKM